MSRRSGAFLMAVAMALAGAARGQQAEDQQLLERGKLALFDGNHQEALEHCRRLQRRYPRSPLLGQAIHCEAMALKSLEQPAPALERFEAYLETSPGSATLREQASLSIIELSTTLHQQGRPEYIDRALDALESREQRLRYYAALRLSYVADREIADRALPVLRQILDREKDPEIRNRATLALLRIDPRLMEREGPEQRRSGRWMRFELVERDDVILSVQLPVSLAGLLAQSLPDEARQELERQGIQAGNLLRELERLRGEILEIQTGRGSVRIWIE